MESKLLKYSCKNYKALLKTRKDVYTYPIIGKWAQFEEHLIKSWLIYFEVNVHLIETKFMKWPYGVRDSSLDTEENRNKDETGKHS